MDPGSPWNLPWAVSRLQPRAMGHLSCSDHNLFGEDQRTGIARQQQTGTQPGEWDSGTLSRCASLAHSLGFNWRQHHQSLPLARNPLRPAQGHKALLSLPRMLAQSNGPRPALWSPQKIFFSSLHGAGRLNRKTGVKKKIYPPPDVPPQRRREPTDTLEFHKQQYSSRSWKAGLDALRGAEPLRGCLCPWYLEPPSLQFPLGLSLRAPVPHLPLGFGLFFSTALFCKCQFETFLPP